MSGMSGWPEIPTPEMEGDPTQPYCPMCGRYAADMDELDGFIFESEEDMDVRGPATPAMRNFYVRQEEGTYNPANGHFLDDLCYIKAGMPSSPSGWRCP